MNFKSKHVVRHMMDDGLTCEAIAAAMGLKPSTVETLQYRVRRPGETIRPNGRPFRQIPQPSVKVTARLMFTPEQMRRMRDRAASLGYARPAILMEVLLAVIADDNLFDAILGDADAD
jgi:hypothetical protein